VRTPNERKTVRRRLLRSALAAREVAEGDEPEGRIGGIEEPEVIALVLRRRLSILLPEVDGVLSYKLRGDLNYVFTESYRDRIRKVVA